MPINQLLKGSKHTPKEIRLLNTAFDQALRLLSVLDRDDPLCKMVAQNVIDIRAAGVSDPHVIAEMAIARLELK